MQTQQTDSSLGSRLAILIGTFFYVGYAPIASGTFGSLATFPLFFLLNYANSWPVYLAGIILITIAGVWAAGRVEQDTKSVDPSIVVIDEVAGQLITLFLIPVSWWTLTAGFFLFRALDIIKPFPARNAEHLPGGWGIMMDDVLAGIYGNLILRLVIFAVQKF